MRTLAWCLALTLACLRSVAQADLVKLREAGRMPAIDLSLQFEVRPSAAGGFLSPLAPRDYASEARRLRKAIAAGAADAQHYLDLARVEEDANHDAAARAAAGQATRLARAEMKHKPNNAASLASLGDALHLSAQDAEAVRVLRKAVKLDSRSWCAWYKLADVLGSLAWGTLWGAPSAKPAVSGVNINPAAVTHRTSAAELAAAESLLKEARAACDRVLSAAPESADACLAHASALMHGVSLAQAAVTAQRGGKHMTLAEFLLAHAEGFVEMLPWTELASDGAKAARLRPEDMVAQMFGIWTAATRSSLAMGSGAEGYQLDAAAKATVRTCIGRLDSMTRSGSRSARAQALLLVGFVRCMVLKDVEGARAQLQDAVVLDSRQDTAWDLLLYMDISADDKERALQVSLDRCAKHDSPYARFLAAKCYEKLQRYDEADRQIDAALKINTNYVLAQMSRASLLIDRSGNAPSMVKALAVLVRMQERVVKANDSMTTAQYETLYGVCCGLAGDTRQATKHLQRALSAKPDYTLASDAVMALGTTP